MDQLIDRLYWYCTDFCIHMANLLGISYVEFNFWLFILFFPLVTLLLLILNIKKYFFKRQVRRID